MGDMIDRDAVQSELRAYLVHESGEIALNVEQIIAAIPAASSHPLADDARRALEADDVYGWINSLPAAPAEDVRAGALREAFDAILGPLSEMAGKSTLDITVEWKDGPHKATFKRNLRPQDVLALIPGAKP